MSTIREDNNGFVNFPPMNLFDKSEEGKTLIYLVAFDTSDLSERYVLSNIKMDIPKSAKFITDDLSGRYLTLNDVEEGPYFPKKVDIHLTTCICLGWNDYVYNFHEDGTPWYATFRDLSNEGRKIYYSIKKLHNNKEVRILTFNLI